MSHATRWQALLVPCLLATLAACSGGGGSDASGGAEAPLPPAPAQTDYTGLVRELFANTADDTDPVQVAELDFLFADQANPEAFDDLLE